MSTTKNVQMSEFNRTDYDILLPQTRLDFELGNEYMWAKLNVAAGYYEIQTLKDSIYVIDSETKTYTFRYSGSITIDEDGNLSLTNPLTFTATYTQFRNNYGTTLLGKYLDTTGLQQEFGIIFIPTNASINYYNGRQVDIKNSYTISVGYDVNRALVGYVNSPSPNAYPPAVSDGYTYKLLGKVAESMRAEIGNYVGTGGYYKGEGPHLIFNIKPKLLVITTTEITNNYTYAYQPQVINFEASKYAHDEAIKQYGKYNYLQLSTLVYNQTSWYGEIITDNEIKWFIQSGDAAKAYNQSGRTYHYLAIG